MHICADEIIAVSTLLTSGLPFIPRVRAFFKRIFKKVFTPAPVVDPTDCGDLNCDLCAVPAKLEGEAEEMRRWLEHVAPLLGKNPPPDMAKYTWEDRILRDGSGYLVAGIVYPFFPTPPGSDYYRDREGLRLATQEESAKMRAEGA